ncbi:uncharacterized protein LOC133351698 [Lethenteron reissneri]|uniref:uncharacterized protein LOC133351698 n=1 Tax=Lethenteron reissneri TaxID=7753 RepID=UPI002AB7DD8B|nr:uncharacterized protein LOC133351698 [Lethenteron reissneri]
MPLGKADVENILNEYGPQCKILQTACAIYLTQTDDKTGKRISGITCIIESWELLYLIICADGKLETICYIENQIFVETTNRTLEFESWKGRKMVLMFSDEEELDKLAGSLPPHLVKRKGNTTLKTSFKSKLRWWPGRSLDFQTNTQQKKKQTPEGSKNTHTYVVCQNEDPEYLDVCGSSRDHGKESKAPKPGPPPPPPPPLSTLPHAQNEDAERDTKCQVRLQQCPICHWWYPFRDIIWHASACGEHELIEPISTAEHT